MKTAVFFVVLQLCDCKPQLTFDSRSVNLVLDTVLRFENKDMSADIKVIDKMGDILDKVRSIIDAGMGRRRRNDEDSATTFTEFIKKTIIILKDYSDEDLAKIIRIAYDQIRLHNSKGRKTFDPAFNGISSVVTRKLRYMKSIPLYKLRMKLDDVLEKLKVMEQDKKTYWVPDYINSLYSSRDSAKFNKYLNRLSQYKHKDKRRNLDLTKIVGKGIQSLVIDHYKNLNYDTRKNLKIKFMVFWSQLNSLDNKYRHVGELNTGTKTPPKIAKKGTNDVSSDSDSVEALDLTTRQPVKQKKWKNKRVVKKEHKIKNDVKIQQTTRPVQRYITLYPEPINDSKGEKESTESTELISPALQTKRTKRIKKIELSEKYVTYPDSIMNDSNDSNDPSLTKSTNSRFTIVARSPENGWTATSGKELSDESFDEDIAQEIRRFDGKNDIEGSKKSNIDRTTHNTNINNTYSSRTVETSTNNIDVQDIKLSDINKNQTSPLSELEMVNANKIRSKLTTLILPKRIAHLPKKVDNHVAVQEILNHTTTEGTTTSNENYKLDFRNSENELDVDLNDNTTFKNAEDNNVITNKIQLNTTPTESNFTDSVNNTKMNNDSLEKLDNISLKDEGSNETDIASYFGNSKRDGDYKDETIKVKIAENIKRIVPETNEKTSVLPVVPTTEFDDATDPLDILGKSDEFPMK